MSWNNHFGFVPLVAILKLEFNLVENMIQVFHAFHHSQKSVMNQTFLEQLKMYKTENAQPSYRYG